MLPIAGRRFEVGPVARFRRDRATSGAGETREPGRRNAMSLLYTQGDEGHAIKQDQNEAVAAEMAAHPPNTSWPCVTGVVTVFQRMQIKPISGRYWPALEARKAAKIPPKFWPMAWREPKPRQSNNKRRLGTNIAGLKPSVPSHVRDDCRFLDESTESTLKPFAFPPPYSDYLSPLVQG